MPDFAWPWLFLALPMPWIVARWWPVAPPSGRPALKVPHGRAIVAMNSGQAPMHSFRMRRWLPWLGWLLLCVAAARPQQLGDAMQQPHSGRDLLLAVDLSGSMTTSDMQLGGVPVDRLTAIKAVLGDFLTRRVGDRVGLILFGTQAYAVTPMTYDRQTVRQQLQSSEAGLAGQDTAIGDAIALAVKRVRATPPPDEGPSRHVLVLLTDGVSNAGVIEPLKAAQLAAANHVHIYTIGFGGDGPSDPFAALAMPMQVDGVDEETLRKIAQLTGGEYYRARDTASLAGIYSELDRIEPALRKAAVERPRTELYPWFLAAALLLAAGVIALPVSQRAPEPA
jgi:Ca-activated chloride channel family protein